jgi:hypothetical protein
MREKKKVWDGVLILDHFFRFLKKLLKLFKLYITLLLYKLNISVGNRVLFSLKTLFQ